MDSEQKLKDGGPAFARAAGPVECGMVANDDQRGMSLRDYFAAAALQGILAKVYESHDGETGIPHSVAAEAYAFADAMLLKIGR